MKTAKTFLILHNIRSSHNIGAIFRTADAVGISKIFLTGYTPQPIDKFGREQLKIKKLALGAEKYVNWEYKKSPNSVIKKLKSDKVKIIAVEQSKNATDYKKLNINSDTAFLFGNEVRGLSKQIQDRCDQIFFIPMKGKKESLNISVAVGTFLFRVLNI